MLLKKTGPRGGKVLKKSGLRGPYLLKIVTQGTEIQAGRNLKAAFQLRRPS
jgi:hypothetical protein